MIFARNYPILAKPNKVCLLFAKRKTEIFVPQQWATVVPMARRKDPYLIVSLKYGDIYDFKDLVKTSMKFRKEDTKGGKINC
jgi:hypothetical protein